MKNVNIKKVVAGAAALAIAAGSLGAVVSAANVADSSYTTPNGLARADMFNAQGAPSYNIVVGSTGHASDVVWAANIAAAIGKKAYNVSTASATGGDVVVEVGSESTSTSISGDGKLFDNATQLLFSNASTTLPLGTIRNRDFSKLFDGDIEIDDIAGKSQTLKNVRETVDVIIDDVYFEDDSDTKAVIAKIPSNGITYALNLGSQGIAYPLTTITDHDIEIPFLGKNYRIRELSATTMKLVVEENKMIYTQGSEFTVEDYIIAVGVITDGGTSGNKVLLSLKENGSVIATESIKSGKSTTFGGRIEEITVTEVNYASDQMGYIEVASGNGVLELTNGEEVDEFTDADDREWTISWDATSPMKIITLKNEEAFDGIGDADFQALKIGDKAILPNGLGSVDFVGLKDETMYDFKFNNGIITWSDLSNTFSIPTYKETSYSSADRSMSFEVDGKTYYLLRPKEGSFDSDGSTPLGEFAISETTTIDRPSSGVVVALDQVAYIPAITAPNVPAPFNITSELDNSTTHKFVVIDSGSKMAIALSNTATGTIGSDGSWSFDGVSEDGEISTAFNLYNDFTYYNRMDFTRKGEAMAKFTITDVADIDGIGSEKTLEFFVDVGLNRLADKGDFDDYSGEKVVYDLSGAAPFSLDDDDSDDLREGITLTGVEVNISGKSFNMLMPEKAKVARFFVGGGASVSSETTLSGGEVTLTTPGEVVDADGIKVKLVSAPQGSATTYTPAAFGNIAYLDTDTLPAGNKIIVGGWMVNEEAKTLGLEDLVTKAGDFVAGKNAQGNIVVAGFHKEDTANAAKELIAAIEAMN